MVGGWLRWAPRWWSCPAELDQALGQVQMKGAAAEDVQTQDPLNSKPDVELVAVEFKVAHGTAHHLNLGGDHSVAFLWTRGPHQA